jgi:Gram-negative bacterial TonB protein C-terminal
VNWPIDAQSSNTFRGIVLAVVLAHLGAFWQLESARPRLRRGFSQGTLIFSGQLLPQSEALPQAVQEPIPASLSSAALPVENASAFRAAAALPPSAVSSKNPSPGTLGQASGDNGDGAFMDYLPRSRLTVPPTPLTDVQVPFPDQVAGIVDLRVVVSLFIDETGAVRRVRLDNPAIPAAFAQSVIDTFLTARFTPGEVNTVPVRSHVRLEIEFRTGAASR